MKTAKTQLSTVTGNDFRGRFHCNSKMLSESRVVRAVREKRFYVRFGSGIIQWASPFLAERQSIGDFLSALPDALNKVN